MSDLKRLLMRLDSSWLCVLFLDTLVMSTVSGLACPAKLDREDWDLVVVKTQMLRTI